MNIVQVKKQAFLTEASYFLNSLEQANEGDLQSCAGLILRILGKEGKASGGLLQVLHLIKNG